VQDSIGNATLAGSQAAVADVVMPLLAKLALGLEVRPGVLCCELFDQVNDREIMADLCQHQIRSSDVFAREVCSALGQTQHPGFFPKGGKALDQAELRQFPNPPICRSLAGEEAAGELVSGDQTVPADPDLRTTSSGKSVCRMRVATNDTRETQFHDIVAWQALADSSAESLRKGATVAVEGRLQTRTWEAGDGSPRRATEIVASAVNAV
jgi:Single-strand binding protein family